MEQTVTGSWAGPLAFLVSIAGEMRYVWRTVTADVRPSAATWLMLTLVHAMIAASAYATSGPHGLWLPASHFIAFAAVAIAALRFGDRTFGRLERLCAIGLASTAIFWAVCDDLAIVTLALIVLDLIALAPTFEKATRDPKSEDFSAWMIATVAAIINLLTADPDNLATLVYPVYFAAINALILVVIGVRLRGSETF